MYSVRRCRKLSGSLKAMGMVILDSSCRAGEDGHARAVAAPSPDAAAHARPPSGPRLGGADCPLDKV